MLGVGVVYMGLTMAAYSYVFTGNGLTLFYLMVGR